MIVLNNKETSMEGTTMHKHPLEDMFRKEIDAYCAYKELQEETEDSILDMALEEIMIDEYLHAKFLRDYMTDKGVYMKDPEDLHEKKFWKIHHKLFQDD